MEESGEIVIALRPGIGQRLPAPAQNYQYAEPFPWKERTRAAVEKLEKELPPMCSVVQLAAYFQVPYGKIQGLWLTGRLAVNHEGRRITINRAAVAEYVENYGVPHVKKRVSQRRKQK
jgi:hypothetical protein